MDLLRQISSSGRTVVLTTHHMDEAESLCDRVAIMDHGKILKAGPRAALVRELDQPLRISVESGLISAAQASDLAGREAAVADDGVSLSIATSDRRRSWPAWPGPTRWPACGSRAPPWKTSFLEDVFLSLTGREYRA